MKKRTFVSIALAVALVFALAAPAFAQSASYSYDLNMDGTIDQEMQVGHICNSGAELKQTIMGTGTMTKALDAAMVQGKITVTDTNDFVTAANAVRNLTVTSVIELCTPAKMTYEDNMDWANNTGDYVEGVVHPSAWYLPDVGFAYPRYWGILGWDGVNDPYEWAPDQGEYEELTKQIWAVQVEADAGFSGALHQDFEAAYGPYFSYGAPVAEYEVPDGLADHWTWGLDDDGALIIVQGDDYVGDYFNIEQFARTSQGTVKRFIDISSPWSHGYLMVDSSITGRVEATDEFNMDNIEAGSDAADNWWNLF